MVVDDTLRTLAGGALAAMLVLLTAGASGAQSPPPLLQRPSERPVMTTSIPHLQLDVQLRVAVHDLLFRSAFALPDVENGPSNVVGAREIRLPDRFLRRRIRSLEFGGIGIGHIHSDGSLHLHLPETRIRDVVNTRWGARHPTIRDYVMLFTPQSRAELTITFQLVVEAYNYATGRELQAEDYLPPTAPALSAPPIETVYVGDDAPLYHDERRCVALQGQEVRETRIYDLGTAANPHHCILPSEPGR
jgi:phospholipase/carboxylesterase